MAKNSTSKSKLTVDPDKMQRWVLLDLKAYQEAHGEVFMSVHALAEDVGTSPEPLEIALREMEGVGVLVVPAAEAEAHNAQSGAEFKAKARPGGEKPGARGYFPGVRLVGPEEIAKLQAARERRAAFEELTADGFEAAAGFRPGVKLSADGRTLTITALEGQPAFGAPGA